MGASSNHFSEAELACRHCGSNECTQVLVNALEQLRAEIGLPIRINDAYRCAAHNAAVGGAKASQHLLGEAADVSVIGLNGADLEKAARRCPLIKGIGRSDHSNYLHIDVRDTPGQWCYDAQGKECTYYPPS